MIRFSASPVSQSSIPNILRILSLTLSLAGDVVLACSTKLFLQWEFSSSISAAYPRGVISWLSDKQVVWRTWAGLFFLARYLC